MNTKEWYGSASGSPESNNQRDILKQDILKYTTLRNHPKEGSSWQDPKVTQRQH